MPRKMSEQDKAFIKKHWGDMSVPEIAKSIGFSTSPVYRMGQRLGLGTKPRIKPTSKQARAQGGESKPQSFYEQVASVFAELVSERERLLSQLNSLDGIEEDERGRVAQQRAGLNSRLSRVEDILVDIEPIAEETEALKPRAPDALHELTNFTDLVEYLTSKEARRKEGKLVAKVQAATNLVMQDWTTNLHEYEDGEVDFICMSADSFSQES